MRPARSIAVLSLAGALCTWELPGGAARAQSGASAVPEFRRLTVSNLRSTNTVKGDPAHRFNRTRDGAREHFFTMPASRLRGTVVSTLCPRGSERGYIIYELKGGGASGSDTCNSSDLVESFKWSSQATWSNGALTLIGQGSTRKTCSGCGERTNSKREKLVVRFDQGSCQVVEYSSEDDGGSMVFVSQSIPGSMCELVVK